MMLLQKPLCVCEITSILELTTATVSNHLSYLRKVGFIEDEKEGKWINYRIARNIDNVIIKNLLNSLPEWFSEEKEIMEDLQKVKTVDRYDIICSDKEDKKRF